MATAREIIQAHAARAGRAGFAIQDLDMVITSQVYAVIDRLVHKGLLFRAKAGHRTVRLFERSDWALHWISTNTRAISIANAAHSKACSARERARYTKNSGFLEFGPRLKPQGEAPPITPETKVTLCPGYKPRFEPVEVPGAPRVYYGNQRVQHA